MLTVHSLMFFVLSSLWTFHEYHNNTSVSLSHNLACCFSFYTNIVHIFLCPIIHHVSFCYPITCFLTLYPISSQSEALVTFVTLVEPCKFVSFLLCLTCSSFSHIWPLPISMIIKNVLLFLSLHCVVCEFYFFYFFIFCLHFSYSWKYVIENVS